MKEDNLALLRGLVTQFAIPGEFLGAEPFGTGHINHTFRSRWDQAGTPIRYLHQRINDNVFKHPPELMDNISRVTGHIAAKIRGRPGWSRRTLTVVPAWDGRPFVQDSEGGYWRTYLFIEKSHSQEIASSPEEASFLGKSIGHFQNQLSDLGGKRLHEVIPDFHNMEYRYRNFYRALEQDRAGRRPELREEIQYMEENEERTCVLTRLLREGKIPERICHNDTKMNNILIDDETGEALCVGDLDTVMPGSPLFDVGDLIRTVTTRAEEDEVDLSKVVFDITYYRSLLSGYLSEAASFLCREELELLPEAGRCITHIMAIRFLTDYLEGDHYYQISRPDHNRDRCRNQIALIRSMDRQWDDILQATEMLRPGQGA